VTHSKEDASISSQDERISPRFCLERRNVSRTLSNELIPMI
jgi:hypothetical protein